MSAIALPNGLNSTDSLYVIGGNPRLTVKSHTAETMTIGGYLVSFGDSDRKDIEGQWFTKGTNYGPHRGDGEMAVINHRVPITQEMKALTEIELPAMSVTEDDLGLWAEIILDLRDKYQRWVGDLALKGAWSFSSGSSPHLARIAPTGEITHWPIIEGSLTPVPVEPRIANHITTLKAYTEFAIMDNPAAGQNGTAAAGTAGATATAAATGAPAVTTPANAGTAAGAVDVFAVPMKSLPQFAVIAVKSQHFGNYLSQNMTQEALNPLMWALNCATSKILYDNGSEPNPEDVAKLPEILDEFSEIYLATVMALMGVLIAETAEEGAEEGAGGAPAMKSALAVAVDYAIKASAVLSSQNYADLKAGVEHHTKGMEMIQGVIGRHEAKGADADATATKSNNAELARLRKENAELLAAQAAKANEPAAVKSIPWGEYAATFEAGVAADN